MRRPSSGPVRSAAAVHWPSDALSSEGLPRSHRTVVRRCPAGGYGPAVEAGRRWPPAGQASHTLPEPVTTPAGKQTDNYRPASLRGNRDQPAVRTDRTGRNGTDGRDRTERNGRTGRNGTERDHRVADTGLQLPPLAKLNIYGSTALISDADTDLCRLVTRAWIVPDF